MTSVQLLETILYDPNGTQVSQEIRTRSTPFALSLFSRVSTMLSSVILLLHFSILDGGVFLEDYHFDRMLSSAKDLAKSYAMDKEKFLQELIPTPSELAHKLEGAIKNGGKDNCQRVKKSVPFLCPHVSSDTLLNLINQRDSCPFLLFLSSVFYWTLTVR